MTFMKTSTDPRHQRRIDIVKELFAESFLTQAEPHSETAQIVRQLSTIDQSIAESAPQWPLDKVAKIDLAILRLAAYELLIVRTEPPKVIIDEAVELAKEFGGESSGPFINGVLGTILKNSKLKTQKSEA